MDPKTLRAELERLRNRLRRLFAIYGALRLLASLGLALAALYLLDRSLALPAGMRLLLLLVTSCGIGYLVHRHLVRPLLRRIRPEDVACAVEKRFPEFDGRLISTLELEGQALVPDRNISVELVEVLRQETGSIRSGVKLDAIFDYRHLKRVGLLALAILAVDLGHAVSNPELAGIFVKRLFGSDQRWPQSTFLVVEFPGSAEHFSVEFDEDHPSRVRIARGASLPVTVRHRGTEPESVELRTRAAESSTGGGVRTPPVALSPTAGDEWVGRFRNVRDSFEFWAHDGNANNDGRVVLVEVYIPPGVVAVQTTLAFPEYTGLARRSEPRGDIEAPTGTLVELGVTVSGDVERGQLVFDTGETPLELISVAGEQALFNTSFEVVESCSYSIQLLGRNGFGNLEPTSYAVIAVKDRPPTVRLVEPARANLDVTPTGLAPYRVAIDDDYGVAGLELSLSAYGGEQQTEPRVFDLLEADSGNDRKRKLVYTLIDLAKNPFPHKDGIRASQVGDSYVYVVAGTDNHAAADGPAPNRTEVSERRLDVVSVNEKMRLLTERQIRLKDDVRSVRDLQAEKRQRLREVLADYESSEGDDQPDAEDLASLEIGQNQVTNRTVRLCREFADLFEAYLLNRLDPSAAAERMIPLLVERKRSSTVVDGFDFSIYRPIVQASDEGAFGALDVLGRLLEMLACVLDVAEQISPQAGRAISDARLLVDQSSRPDGIRAAVAAQDRALARLDELLEKMDEWEDFQEILTLFRDLLEDQRDLNARTRDALRTDR